MCFYNGHTMEIFHPESAGILGLKQVKKTPVCTDRAYEKAPDHNHHKQVVDIYSEQPSKNLGS